MRRVFDLANIEIDHDISISNSLDIKISLSDEFDPSDEYYKLRNIPNVRFLDIDHMHSEAPVKVDSRLTTPSMLDEHQT